MRIPVDSILGAIRDRRFVDMADRVSGWLLPPRCTLCGARGQEPCFDLCGACECSLPEPDQPLQLLPGPLGHCFAAFRYDYPVVHLLHALKYRGQLAVGRVLGTLLADRIVGAELHRDVDILLPVPLHPVRHAERGYNQSSELARWAARRLGYPLEPTLAARLRHTPPQVGLSLPQRRSNMSGAFAVSSAASGRHITVIDDVTTTGSTLTELAGALLAAGAAGVNAWCVARAERHGNRPVTSAEPSPRTPAMR